MSPFSEQELDIILGMMDRFTAEEIAVLQFHYKQYLVIYSNYCMNQVLYPTDSIQEKKAS